MRRDVLDYARAEAVASARSDQSKALERLQRRRRTRAAWRAAQADQGRIPPNEPTGRAKTRRRRRAGRWFAPAAIGAAALGWVGWAAGQAPRNTGPKR